MSLVIRAAAVVSLLAITAVPALAMPVSIPSRTTPLIEQVAGGCGPGAWRGPWGHCRSTPYYGRLPNGYYQTRVGNGCPPGYWRGPWGHCRNTPYHGRLSGGGWK
jgi:hypothetical protein